MVASHSEDFQVRGETRSSAFDVWTRDFQPILRVTDECIRGTDYEAMDLAELGNAIEGALDDAVDALLHDARDHRLQRRGSSRARSWSARPRSRPGHPSSL